MRKSGDNGNFYAHICVLCSHHFFYVYVVNTRYSLFYFHDISEFVDFQEPNDHTTPIFDMSFDQTIMMRPWHG